MTEAATLKASLESSGFRLRRQDGKLLITPASRLSAEQVETVRTHKAALLELLSPIQEIPESGLASPERILAHVRGSKLLGIDLETTGLNPRKHRTRLLSVSDGKRTLVLDCFAHDARPVAAALTDKIVVAHNAIFDMGFLWHLGLTNLPEIVCTHVLGQLLTAGEGGGAHGFPPLKLADCCRRWLDVDVDKEEQCSDWSGSLTESQIEYARKDAAVLLPLLRALNRELDAAGLLEVVDVEMRAIPAFVWMSQTGVPFDKPAWQSLADQSVKEVAALEQRLNEAAPERPGSLFDSGWNWSSPVQVKEALQLLGYTVTGTDDSKLAEIDHPVATLLRDHRAATKKATTYGTEWLAHVNDDGRVYPSWRQIGASSGRTSCKDPNMQQLPREKAYRACVVASPGHVFVKADYSQLQLRIAAKMSGDPKMLSIYAANGDIHTETAKALLAKQDVTKADRQVAKSANFGLLFGMSASGLRVYAKANYGVDFTTQEAEQHRVAFFKAYAGLAKWHAKTKKLHCSETRGTSGRRRKLPDNAPDTWRLNSPVQADESDGAKLGLALLWERRVECPNARPVLLVHDEIVVEVPETDAVAAKNWLERCMMQGMEPWLNPVPVVVEATIKKTWGD